jgi:hypothetical protein
MSRRKRQRPKHVFRKPDYSPDEAPENSFTAYIVKGNRQVIRREVVASKRFRVDEETYIIRPECIFLKNVDGVLRSVSYYREGNPNPYNFKEENLGIKADELDRIFAEDFYHIVTNLQPENRMRYILFVVGATLSLSITFTILMILRVYVWR